MSQKELLQKFKPVFYPESIAVVGVAPNEKRKASYRWIEALLDSSFGGRIYPVGLVDGEILGLKIYPSLLAIPENVDFASVHIPRDAVPGLLDDCIAKKVSIVHFFTAGFSESGDPRGRDMEKELLTKAQQGGFRIIGPNSAGIYNPESKIPYGAPGIIGESGSIGYICQSGSIGGKLAEIGVARGIKYSKGVSIGNGIDLDSPDFLEYLGADPKTSVIGSYLEGSRHGKRLFRAMRKIAKVKPLIVWKGGRTEAGAEAAKSHTGSLSSPSVNWSAALKQAGAIEVYSLEELTDTLLIFQQLHRWQGKGIAIVGGFVDGGGGICVSASDIFAEYGLVIPRFAPATEQHLGNLLGRVVNILHNPVDVCTYGRNMTTLQEAILSILADPVVDLLLIQEDMGILLRLMDFETVHDLNDVFIDLRTRQDKPVVAILPPGLFELERLEIERKLSEASIPVFHSLERAAKAISNLSHYSRSHAKI